MSATLFVLPDAQLLSLNGVGLPRPVVVECLPPLLSCKAKEARPAAAACPLAHAAPPPRRLNPRPAPTLPLRYASRGARCCKDASVTTYMRKTKPVSRSVGGDTPSEASAGLPQTCGECNCERTDVLLLQAAKTWWGCTPKPVPGMGKQQRSRSGHPAGGPGVIILPFARRRQ